MPQLRMILFLALLLPGAIARRGSTPALELKAGDNRIVFVGDGFIEQAQFSGYIETRLARRFPDYSLVCSNLGWSGDDVWGSARTPGYENPAQLDRLKKEATALKPDIIFVGYGLDESFAGTGGLPHFVDGYNQLLELLGKLTPKLILLSPPMAEDLGRPMPDQIEHNRDIEQYTAAIKSIADQRHLPFVDLFHPMAEFKRVNPAIHLTHNGILLNETGYWLAAEEMEKQLGLQPESAHLAISSDGKILSAQGMKAAPMNQPAGDGFSLHVTSDYLPAPAADATLSKIAGTIDPAPTLQFTGLAPGNWTLTIDGKPAASASAAEWNSGVNILAGPDVEQAEKLRSVISARNDLYYRRWRPFNDHSRHWTYIGGDFALYDKEVALEDAQIADLAKPVSHLYSLSKSAAAKP